MRSVVQNGVGHKKYPKRDLLWRQAPDNEDDLRAKVRNILLVLDVGCDCVEQHCQIFS